MTFEDCREAMATDDEGWVSQEEQRLLLSEAQSLLPELFENAW